MNILKMMKTINFLYILVLIYSGCSSSEDSYQKDNLIGDWERYGDAYSGAIVSVEYNKENGLLQGWVTVVSDSMYSWGFRAYDLKWLDIERKDNRYSFRDLVKKIYFLAITVDMTQDEIDRTSTYTSFYKNSNLYFINKDTICIKRKGNKTLDLGLKQYWKRIKY